MVTAGTCRRTFWTAIFVVSCFSPLSAWADGANEYGGDLLKSGEASSSLQTQVDFVEDFAPDSDDTIPSLVVSPDILLGLNGGFEVLVLAAVNFTFGESTEHAFDPLLTLLRYQLLDGLAVGAGPVIPIEEEHDLEGLVGLYYSHELPSSVSWTTNLGAQLNGDNSDKSSWFGVLTVQYALPTGTQFYVETDFVRGWHEDTEAEGMGFVGAQFGLSEKDSLNLFFSTPVLGDPGLLDQWGVGLIYAVDWGSAS